MARPGSFDFTLQRTGCLTLIFLSLLLVVPLVSSSAAPPFNEAPPVNIDADPVTLNENGEFRNVEEGTNGPPLGYCKA